MDVVYICRAGENEELRYSLRTLENIYHEDVWIFGGKPDWVQNVNFIGVPQKLSKDPIVKHQNCIAALHSALKFVPNDFILMNDDFYITKKIGVLSLYDWGTIDSVIQFYENMYKKDPAAKFLLKNPYIENMRITRKCLVNLGIDNPLSFELHVPIPIRKDKMRAALEIGATIGPNAHIRTIYGNLLQEPSTTIPDVKIYKSKLDMEAIPDTPFLSTSEETFRTILPMLNYFFRAPCKYER